MNTPLESIDFPLRGDHIPLDALLKATGLAHSGGAAKMMVAEGRIKVVAHGQTEPLAPNSSAEGRAKNRRIALVVLPEELAGVDVPKPAPGPAPSPAPKTKGPD